MFEGVIPALITPFHDDPSQSLDLDGLRNCIEHVIKGGVHGLLACGSTGESATMTHAEHIRVIEETVSAAHNRLPVIAGTGSNNTDEALLMSRGAKLAGADAVLLISPYYNKPNRSGLLKHYRKVADIGLPVIVYNIPGRTGQNLAPDLILEMARTIPNIVAVKEASGNINQMMEIVNGINELDREYPFILTCGDDSLTLPVLSIGGEGVISVTANIEPERMVEMYNLFRKCDTAGAIKKHYELLELSKALFMDVNPVPVKRAAELRGLIKCGNVRLPLDNLSPEMTEKLRTVLSHYD
ncbi:MAG TPA: 4-hydroxy-tetrahydrodipicolinate synthase [Methanocorpusculum sp.]|nr:4-hydroxy-tetrahydrodipicolinate synthase [Methanocorpusculum sp.]HJJ39840.1 4-hydroxy-tetrahydrodipicolinate synthase [Methanocorpusculum sp.]HJJ49207.1 4-hydroxy-tetrahydrodipicolinate synthase [Methanocorpusculum sp.]HJJ56865.1 4-hydroxy-tetrahydrodipicolinate synthase [Methanocorpusculum sp.]HJJ95037.1 4-hydroxy-tetrahydrodipicolinate synthase [Methanocorpusculum sp.]